MGFRDFGVGSRVVEQPSQETGTPLVVKKGEAAVGRVITKKVDKPVITPETTSVITADSELCDRCKEILRLRTARSRKKK